LSSDNSKKPAPLTSSVTSSNIVIPHSQESGKFSSTTILTNASRPHNNNKRVLHNTTKIPQTTTTKRTTFSFKKAKRNLTVGTPIAVPREGTQSPEPSPPIRASQHTSDSHMDKTGIKSKSSMTTNLSFALPEWASAIQKQVTQQGSQHESLVELIKSQQAQLTQQHEQLAEQQRFATQQQALLLELFSTIKALQDTVMELKALNTPFPAPQSTPRTATAKTPATLQTPTSASSVPKGTETSIWAQARETAPAIFESTKATNKPNRAAPRRMPPARFFSSPPSERSSYTVTYLQVRHRSTQRQVREQLRALKINTARILDITQPASGVVGLLHHSDFTTALKDSLTTNEITVIDFDPRSPGSIRDPKIQSLTTEQKERVALHLHNATCLKGLAGMPAHIRRSVAHDYFAKGYITSNQYDYHLGKAVGEEVKAILNPVTVAALIASFSDDDHVMSQTSPSSSRRNSVSVEST
jgi:hypothetical protein